MRTVIGATTRSAMSVRWANMAVKGGVPAGPRTDVGAQADSVEISGGPPLRVSPAVDPLNEVGTIGIAQGEGSHPAGSSLHVPSVPYAICRPSV